jgi:predicted ATP-grasp superfamily ATP-dependent carboligase
MSSFGFGDHEALKVLLYEHVSSGGYAGESIPLSLLCEGFGMLKGLTSDFKAAGHEVTVLLDRRIAELNPPLESDHFVQITSSEEADPAMEKTAEESDAVYVVAPEPNHVLQSIIECIETTGTFSLNCQALGIEQAADKASLGERVKRLGLNFPNAATFSAGDSVEGIGHLVEGKIGFPAVIKPLSGAGCSGLSIIRTKKQLTEGLAKIKRETACEQVVAQELIDGTPVSVSLISNGVEALPVSLNLQEISLASPEAVSSYEGGLVPFEHPLKAKAYVTARRLVESFGSLRGYVGVDMVLTSDKAFVMEINPRLTTSYVGLRKVANFNTAEAIVTAVMKNELPKNPQNKGFACFSKVQLNHLSSLVRQRMSKMAEVVSPPFPMAESDLSYGLVLSCGDSLEKACFELGEVKRRLQLMLKRGE